MHEPCTVTIVPRRPTACGSRSISRGSTMIKSPAAVAAGRSSRACARPRHRHGGWLRSPSPQQPSRPEVSAGGVEDAGGRGAGLIHNWIRLGFEAVETLLAGSSETGTFCHGANATHADIYLAPQVYNAERFDYPMERHPTIARVTASAMEHDAFARAYPDRQPDAE